MSMDAHALSSSLDGHGLERIPAPMDMLPISTRLVYVTAAYPANAGYMLDRHSACQIRLPVRTADFLYQMLLALQLMHTLNVPLENHLRSSARLRRRAPGSIKGYPRKKGTLVS